MAKDCFYDDARTKKFEKNLELNHRLSLTYACNQPGDVPPVPRNIPTPAGRNIDDKAAMQADIAEGRQAEPELAGLRRLERQLKPKRSKKKTR